VYQSQIIIHCQAGIYNPGVLDLSPLVGAIHS